MSGGSISQPQSLFEAQWSGVRASGESVFSVVALSHRPKNSLTISVLVVTVTGSFRSLRIGEEGPQAPRARRRGTGGADSPGNHPTDLRRHRGVHAWGQLLCVSVTLKGESYI